MGGCAKALRRTDSDARRFVRTGGRAGRGANDWQTWTSSSTLCGGEGYYPPIDPPRFSASTVGSIVRVLNPNDRGTLYFTLDGRDPRVSGGEVASGAFTGTGDREEVVVRRGATLKARVRTRKAWSALATWP